MPYVLLGLNSRIDDILVQIIINASHKSAGKIQTGAEFVVLLKCNSFSRYKGCYFLRSSGEDKTFAALGIADA
jgi:hypothetical protein